MAKTTHLEIFADYHQIYVSDPAYAGQEVAQWTNDAVADRVVNLTHVVAFGTGRNMTVPVGLVEHEGRPDMTKLAEGADHAVLAGLTCTAGNLEVEGCGGFNTTALSVRSGPVGALFLSFALDNIDNVNGLDGNDRYELHIWPDDAVPMTKVLRRWPVAGG